MAKHTDAGSDHDRRRSQGLRPLWAHPPRQSLRLEPLLHPDPDRVHREERQAWGCLRYDFGSRISQGQ
ncbi:desiccation-related protein at2g46140 [Phtheirospermum japonicum]|uniref:Desiccation-related protein at2g46140 n=1 Tax=Phtheirospermum japonicum TaxID=374723 RepID=A0A830BCC5_9LAMI|nr:desiccation-related protein at2g46140 [Phtheirospermum japonicum]